jgi:hypothetical protein
MTSLNLYMLLLGCRPKGRHTEQHDIFFTIGTSLSETIPAIKEFWPEAKGNIHIDAWREVTQVDGFEIRIVPKANIDQNNVLFFINLGGYKQNEFEEYHYKILTVADTLDKAKAKAKETAFYKHVGIKGAPSHIDDKFGIDADDLHKIDDILPEKIKTQYSIEIKPASVIKEDEIHLAYLPLYKISK